ncbi:hypothetical protein [Candidatus Hecatella orcuttiae]|uniref:hypothetical protein n=1 Tax=Candidatus Hecatella orcuttiae TaxID=1935119 RepID=UPI0028681614|nr:hypothetical protein [Candidatus Hecatella orcuttiae]
MKLPSEGFLIRDFMLTTLAYMCVKVGMPDVKTMEASIKVSSTINLAKAYVEVLRNSARKKNLRFYPPDRSAKNKLFSGIKKLSKKLPQDLSGVFNSYADWLESNPKHVEEILKSLGVLRWSGPIDNDIFYFGRNPTIPAAQLFKLNYYAGRRVFLPQRYQDARLYFDIHTFIFTLAGASLSLVGTIRNGPTVYVAVLDPGAIGLCEALQGFINEVKCRLVPEVIFRVASTLKIAKLGVHPIKIVMINEVGNRPSLLSSQNVFVDEGLLRFTNYLKTDIREKLLRLLTFALSDWETEDINQRMIVRIGYEIAQAIYLSTTGALKSADVIYHVARSTYATTGDRFGRALKEAKYSPIRNLDEFKYLVLGIKDALERCVQAP